MRITKHFGYRRDSPKKFGSRAGTCLTSILREAETNHSFPGRQMKELPARRLFGKVGALMVSDSPLYMVKCLEGQQCPRFHMDDANVTSTVNGDLGQGRTMYVLL